MTAEAVKQAEVLGIPVTCFCSYDHAAQVIVRRIRDGGTTLCIAINPEKICFARRDRAFRDVVRTGHIHICDGIGAAAAVRWIAGWRIPRVTGVNLFERLLETADREGLSVFLLGAKVETNEKAYGILRDRYPDLRIVGRRDGYFKNDAEVVREIATARPDMLFAALGSPWQERWLGEHFGAMDVPFCMGVGGSFNVLAGTVRRAPMLFQRTGTEFLYRLVCEPKRWRRQVVLPGFAVRVLLEGLARRGLKALTKSRDIRAVSGWEQG